MSQKILVTGGAGFIGSHLCEELIRKGNYVIALDNLFTGTKENLSDFINDERFQFIKGDIRDANLVNSLIKKVDIIYHLAAIVGVDVVVNNPLENIEVNILGIKNIAEAAFKNGKKKVIFASSSEVYGKNDQVPLKEEGSPAIFGSTKITRWSYGQAKSLGEHFLLAYSENGLPFVILRYFNCYGPRGINTKYANVIPKFISQAINNESLTIYGNGKQTRCFCYVSDIVKGTILCEKKLNNEVVNLGTNKETQILSLAKKIIKLGDSKSQFNFIPENKIYKREYEDIKRRVPSIHRAEKVGFKPKIQMDGGLKKTIIWTKHFFKYRQKSI